MNCPHCNKTLVELPESALREKIAELLRELSTLVLKRKDTKINMIRVKEIGLELKEINRQLDFIEKMRFFICNTNL